MKLKVGTKKTYGIPYQGSKTKLIEHIAKFFPNADHFYDLFGGGFSVTHYLQEHRRKSFKHFHFNEIRPGIPELIKDAIAGKYNYDVFKPEWISREKFLKEKKSNAYIKILWSFGNNGEDYLFAKDLESKKRSIHQAVVFDEFDCFMKEIFGLTCWPNHLNITGKRLYLRKLIKIKRGQQQLERLQQLERTNFTNLDYREVKINKTSVIYCDIPYHATASYGEFSHPEFFDWANKQDSPIFISEYEIKDPRFTLLKKFSHRSSFSSSGLKSIPVVECLYGNKVACDIIEKAQKKDA